VGVGRVGRVGRVGKGWEKGIMGEDRGKRVRAGKGEGKGNRNRRELEIKGMMMLKKARAFDPDKFFKLAYYLQ
jgi:hypothetical protein